MGIGSFSKRFHWSGYLLGFGLGGFFDGILLHQILQWHHLLIGVQGEALRDLRVQILADGLFHALMYVIALAGLWHLWRSRREFAASGADRLLGATVLIGFGGWHVTDAVLSHWLLGIHRIKMNTANPLLWDLAWFVVFGIVPLLIGWMLQRSMPASPPTRGHIAAALLAALVVGSGVASALPPANASQVMVYFGPRATPEKVFNAAIAANARIIWSDKSGDLWAFELPDPSSASSLYRHGALFISASWLPAGCLSWSRAS